MIRSHGHCRLRFAPLLALALLVFAPVIACADGAWTTFIRMQTCNDILAMRDTVWLATGEAGLVRYLRSSGTFEQVVRQPSGLASNNVTALTMDRSGRLWAGTSGKGASRLSADGTAWDLANAFDGLPSDSVTVLRADRDTVWIGTTRGIALWNGRQVAGSVPDIGTPSPFRSNNVNGILVLGDSLIVATSDGVYLGRLSQSLGSWTSADAGITNKNVLDLATTGNEAFALSGGIVYRLNRGTGTWAASSPSGTVRRLADDFGVVMCATVDSLSAWTGTRWAALTGAPVADNSARGAIAFGAAPDGKRFASRAGTLRIEGAPWASLSPPGPVGNDVNNIVADGEQVWVATNAHGMSRWTSAGWTNWGGGCCGPAQTTSFMEPLYAFALQIDRSGHVWSAHWDTGIERIDTRANPLTFMHAFSSYGLPKSDSLSRHSDGWSTACDSSGFVYIGMDTPSLGQYDPIGVDVYDSTGAFVINWRANATNGMLTNQVRAVAIDRINHLVWLGLAGKGLVYTPLDSLDGDRGVTPANDHRRLPNFSLVSATLSKNVFGVVAHGDSIWVLTDSDLKRVRGSDRQVKSTLETIAQPAPVGSVHPLDVAFDGTVWTASVDGVRRFPPGGGHEDFTVENSPLADNEVRALSVEPRTGVVWFGTANGINRYDPHWSPPPAPKLPSLNIKVYPNPSYANNLGISLVLDGNATIYSGEILDITGRIVRRFTAVGNTPTVWDGRDKDGSLVRSGVYFVRAHSGGRDATARIVVLR